MAVRAPRSCWPLLPLLLPLLGPAAAAVPRGVANVSNTQTPSEDVGPQRPSAGALTARQPPPEPPSDASTAQTRFFPFFEFLTPRGRFIPGLAKHSECCGKENDAVRIVGGTDAAENQYPWMAALFLDGDTAPFCGGSLLNNRYVVTAAHCVFSLGPSDVTVVFGRHATSSDSGNDLPRDINIIRIHPQYNDNTLEYDIALLRLTDALAVPAMGNLIAPICMPHRSRYTNKDVVAVGWGDTSEGSEDVPDVLQTVTVHTISNRRCARLLDPLGPNIRKHMICAGAEDLGGGGRDTCQGDSGGPLSVRTWYRPSRHSLIGITSFGIGCARPNRPGVYTRVYSFSDWLIDNMPDASYC